MNILDTRLSQVEQCKQDIKNVLVNKGVDTTNVPFTDYASKINELGLKETVLWQNSSPTTSFTEKTITVENITNYKYIGIQFRQATDVSLTTTIMYTIEDFKKMTNATNQFFGLMGSVVSGSQRYRRFNYKTDTTIFFAGAYDFGGTIRNGTIIPVKVIGYK